MNNYIANICMKYGTYIYYGLLNNSICFEKINNLITTI